MMKGERKISVMVLLVSTARELRVYEAVEIREIVYLCYIMPPFFMKFSVSK